MVDLDYILTFNKPYVVESRSTFQQVRSAAKSAGRLGAAMFDAFQ